jgi:hypothetical protein
MRQLLMPQYPMPKGPQGQTMTQIAARAAAMALAVGVTVYLAALIDSGIYRPRAFPPCDAPPGEFCVYM